MGGKWRIPSLGLFACFIVGLLALWFYLLWQLFVEFSVAYAGWGAR